MLEIKNILHPDSSVKFHFCEYFIKNFPKISFCYLTVNKEFFRLNLHVLNLVPFPKDITSSINNRKLEFLLGRYCAQKALFSLGMKVGLFGRTYNRIPIWPDGFTGSISHSNEHFIAASSNTTNYSAIGIDVEEFISESHYFIVSNFILNPDEKDLINKIDINNKITFLTLFFSAKESFYKLFYQQTNIELDFTVMSIVKFDINYYLIKLNKTINDKYKKDSILKGFYIIKESVVITLMLEYFDSDQKNSLAPRYQ